MARPEIPFFELLSIVGDISGTDYAFLAGTPKDLTGLLGGVKDLRDRLSQYSVFTKEQNIALGRKNATLRKEIASYARSRQIDLNLVAKEQANMDPFLTQKMTEFATNVYSLVLGNWKVVDYFLFHQFNIYPSSSGLKLA